MHAQRKLVSFLGLGSRTAAPLLYSYIKVHPQAVLAMAETKFFSNAKKFALGATWYESNFSQGKGVGVCGELAYDYLTSAQAAGLIARTYPSAKLLAVIENPLVSVRVEYVEARRTGKVSATTSLAMFLKQNPEVLLRARYGRQLFNYFSYYSASDFLVLLASDIRADLLGSVKITYQHLGLDPTFVPLTLKHLVVEEEDDGKKRPGLIKRLYKGIKNIIKRLLLRLIKLIKPPKVATETATEVAQKIILSPELENFLKEYYRQDVKEISTFLHRDLNVEWDI